MTGGGGGCHKYPTPIPGQPSKLISQYLPFDKFSLNFNSAFIIWSSCSKGISPQTMSKRRIPSDQTVAERPWYLWCLIHSGGLYTLVPEKHNDNKKIKMMNFKIYYTESSKKKY